jgi:hypothetical protein
VVHVAHIYLDVVLVSCAVLFKNKYHIDEWMTKMEPLIYLTYKTIHFNFIENAVELFEQILQLHEVGRERSKFVDIFNFELLLLSKIRIVNNVALRRK